jgi:hypothetical protein
MSSAAIALTNESEDELFIEEPEKLPKDVRFPLLIFEQNIMIDTFVDDVLFIFSRQVYIIPFFTQKLIQRIVSGTNVSRPLAFVQ